MAILQFCSELDKAWSEMHACWHWQKANDRFVSTLSMAHVGTHLSENKDPYFMYVSWCWALWKNNLCFAREKLFQMNKSYTKLRHNLSMVYMKLKLIRIKKWGSLNPCSPLVPTRTSLRNTWFCWTFFSCYFRWNVVLIVNSQLFISISV